MDSDRVGYTIGEIVAFFMMGITFYEYRYVDPSLMNAAMVVLFGFTGAVFAARSLELL
ncbi:hypothetical protein [Haloarchaeobius baliensis]|uniref:hypothetical protein n=1 Tax=Haloarchaeobius baliensis TaxID=1670458 RepID=UPI003F882B71